MVRPHRLIHLALDAHRARRILDEQPEAGPRFSERLLGLGKGGGGLRMKIGRVESGGIHGGPGEIVATGIHKVDPDGCIGSPGIHKAGSFHVRFIIALQSFTVSCLSMETLPE